MIRLSSSELEVDRIYQLERLNVRWNFPHYVDDNHIRVDVKYKQSGYLNSYDVRVGYRFSDGTVVAPLRSPNIAPSSVIHLNPNHTLCLFDPRDYPINKRFVLADEIIPWVLEWTFYYEMFLLTGVWRGSEAA
ncbi:MAG: hypothetical protein L6Q81_05025 [Bacteroidia bacterium]|nr:hypothetical protein [Bacteroidia bacterium]